jgi:hypothetical protein
MSPKIGALLGPIAARAERGLDRVGLRGDAAPARGAFGPHGCHAIVELAERTREEAT